MLTALATALLTLLLTETRAQPLLYVSSGERVKNQYPFAGGTSCCNCRVKHYGNLPADFPSGNLEAATFYLLGSRSNSYYTKVQNGPTQLKFILGEREAIATSVELPDFASTPVKHKWYVKFDFAPPVSVMPGLSWELVDGDNNIYSAVLVHSSDTGQGGGLPGIDEQTGCQYTHRVEAKYSVKFDFVGAGPLIAPGKIAGTLPAEQKLREKVLKTAVVEFTERGDLGIQDAGAIIAEWMTTALNRTGAFEVYERLSLEKLMQEHKLGMSGLLEEETIAQIGKMRGVQAIVTGSVIKFGDIISVTAKLIDTETAKIIDSGDIKVSEANRISFEIDKLALELATP
jgi:TolB-like protein